MCQHVKDSMQKQQDLLQPLALPKERFSSYTIDFVFGLPRAKGRDGVWCDGVMTVVNHATKWKTLVAMHEGITAIEATDLLLLWVVRRATGDHLRQRPEVHVSFLEAVVCMLGHTPAAQHSPPSTNRW